MSRRNKPEKRVPLPDAVYNDVEVAKFINRLMTKGKKNTAEKIFYQALDNLEGKVDDKPLEVFKKVIQRSKPLVRVKARRVGGSTYQVPMEVDEATGIAFGSRWLIENARKRNGKTMVEKLSNEFLDTYKGQSATLKKREDVHKMAEANKAFSHYRF